MIKNATQLIVALKQLASFADMLEGMRLHCEKHNSTLFPLVSQAYIHKIRELNSEIREYLQAHPEGVEADTMSVPSAHLA